MQTETEVKASERYLLCNYAFSDQMIERIKTDVRSFMADKKKDDNYLKFINWQKQENDIVVLTLYAYDDILLPKKYDTVFQIDKPSNFANRSFTITQAVLNGWTPVNQIAKGHKHICIIQLDKEVSSIFNSVALFDSKEALQDKFRLGFCDMNNFEAIKNKLQIH